MVHKHCYISGQLSTGEEENFVPGAVIEEAKRALSNTLSIAKAAGFIPEEIIFVDIAFTDLKDVALVNELFEKKFEDGKRPTRTIYQAAVLPYGEEIKVTAIAVKD